MAIEDTIKALKQEQNEAHFLVVDGFSKLMNHKVVTVQSSTFDLGGLKWKLLIYPSGDDDCDQEYLSFYVNIKDKKSLPSNWEVTCCLKLSVLSQTRPNKSKSVEWDEISFKEDQTRNGKESFMLHKVLYGVTKGYLVNDKVVFYAEISDVELNFNVTVLPRSMGTAERLKVMDIPRNNSKFTWKITQFSSFSNGDEHYSYEFTVGPRRWKLSMYPNGTGDGIGNSLSLYLTATDYVTNGPKARTLAIYKFRVLDQLNRNHHESETDPDWFYAPGSPRMAYGWAKFLSLEELYKPSRGLLVNDQIYIGVEFFIVSTTEYL